MGLFFSRPSPLLRPYVKQYWSIEDRLDPGAEHIQRIVPSGLAELTFYFGDIPQCLAPSRNISRNMLLSGQHIDFYDLKITGSIRIFSISLQPQGGMMFFRHPQREFHSRNIPLTLLMREPADKLEDQLFHAHSFTERVLLAEKFLLSQLQKNNKPWESKRVDSTIGLINQAKGLISIDELASRACLSRKQFERSFTEHVGIAPKPFLRIVRFQHAIHLKSGNPSMQLTELAHLCGYYDQPHMNYEFRNLSGITPREYFACPSSSSDYFRPDPPPCR